MTIAVVGAGVTGLTLAHYHDDIEVFEVSERPGGVIKSGIQEDRVLEYGPQRTRYTPGVRELVDDLGLEDEVLRGRDLPLHIYSNEEISVAPTTAAEFLKTELLDTGEKARVVLEPVATLRNRYNDEIDDIEEADISIQDYFERKFGTGASKKFISPLYAGIYGSDPREMPAEYSLHKLMKSKGIPPDSSLLTRYLMKKIGKGETPQPVTFRNGMETLTNALYRANRQKINLDTRVESVSQKQDRVEVETSEFQKEYESVVVTTPAHAAAEIIDSESVQKLGNLEYNSLAYAHLKSTIDLESMGFQIAYPENRQHLTLGVTSNHGLFRRKNLYTSFLGGMNHPKITEKPDEEIEEAATQEFEEITDGEAEAIDVTKLENIIPAYDESWNNLQKIQTPPDIHLAANYLSRPGVPSRIKEGKQLAKKL